MLLHVCLLADRFSLFRLLVADVRFAVPASSNIWTNRLQFSSFLNLQGNFVGFEIFSFVKNV